MARGGKSLNETRMRTLTSIAVGILVVGGLVVGMWWQPRPKRIVQAPVRSVVLSTNGPTHDPARSATEPNRARQSPWAALRTGDYDGFVLLLRQSGCPEETVQLFATAALGREAQKRVEAPELLKAKRSVYWRDELQERKPTWPAASQQERARIEKTLAQLLQVPGGAITKEFIEVNSPPDWLDRGLRVQLSEILARQETELDPYATGAMSDTERAELLELKRRHRAELEQLLGREKREEYEARESLEADFVRRNLPPARDEAEFRRMVAAANDVGMTMTEVLTDSLPAAAVPGKPTLRSRVLNRLRELSDPTRSAELEEAAAAEEEARKNRQDAERERQSLADLQVLARAGGVDLNDEEAHRLHAAVRERGAQLDRELGDPGKMPEAERAKVMQRVKTEMESVAVSTLGEKGRVVFEQMLKRDLKDENQAKPGP